MPITAQEAQPGTKVKIPNQKKGFKAGSDLEQFRKEILQSDYQLPYLIIGPNPKPKQNIIGLTFPHGVQGEVCTNSFHLEDLDLYTEPTSYPLPDESFERNTEDPITDLPPGAKDLLHQTWKEGLSDTPPFPTEDPVNPTHYNGKEVFNQMVALFGGEAVKGFCQCNAFKYRMRAGKKSGNSVEQDINKALWYEKELSNLTSHGE